MQRLIQFIGRPETIHGSTFEGQALVFNKDEDESYYVGIRVNYWDGFISWINLFDDVFLDRDSDYLSNDFEVTSEFINDCYDFVFENNLKFSNIAE